MTLLSALLLFTLTGAVSQSAVPMPASIRSFQELQKGAAALAEKPYVPQPEIPASLKGLTYDQFRHIGFINGKEIWTNTRLPFRIGFYHKGYVHGDDVTVNLLEEGRSVPVPFSRKFFHYLYSTKDLEIPDDLGFAGFRAWGCFPGQEQFQEIFTFVGASYFRARAAKTILGTSARGLAVNCGLPKPEEFPIFREYWISKPKLNDASLHVLALLDSPSVAGAYELVMTPGIEKSDIAVHQSLYFRQAPEKIGIAPMSSMWLWGDGLHAPVGDHRPEVHDADGLQVQTPDGKWLWRTLCQQTYPSLIHLKYGAGVTGFGLIQRDTDPNHYLDDEARYDIRPSVWIEPRSEWGPGAIELLELPAPHEGIDNIAAWWVPEEPIVPGKPVDMSYRVSFCSGDRPDHLLGKGVAYRIDRSQAGRIGLEIDFDGPVLADRSANSPPFAEVVSIRGAVPGVKCQKQGSGVWTVSLDVRPTGEGPVELTVVLKEGDQELTETWACLCSLTAPPVSLPPWKMKQQEEEAKP